MNIIAIESATTVCGVALFTNGKLIDIIEYDKPRIHGSKLPVMVKKIANKNLFKFSEINAIAVSSGPGSFTGLRIGINLAKGLASALKVPIVPISTIIAINSLIRQKGIYWIILHAYKNNVYAQCFDSGKPISDVHFEEFDNAKYKMIYGFNLDELVKKYILASPSAKLIGELAFKNYKECLINDLDLVRLNYNYHLKFVKIDQNDTKSK